jgi:hypothetical protein
MLLRRTFLVNGIATAMTGALAVVASPWLPAILGRTSPAVLAIVGAGLVVFAGVLLTQARRERIDRRVAWAITVVDIAWVLGSIVLVEAGVLTLIGNLIVAAVAAVVLVFAILEVRGIAGLRAAAS